MLLEKRLLDAMDLLDGKMPTERVSVDLTEGEMRLLLHALTLRTAVRNCSK